MSAPSGQSLSRQEHDTITEIKLVRRRTLAAQRSENQPQNPPWDGKMFPTMGEARTAAPTIRDGRVVVDGIRKNSLALPRYDPPQSMSQSPPMGGSPPLPQLKRYVLSDTTSPSPPPGPNSSNRTASPNRFITSMAPSSSRPPSPGRRLRKSNEHNNSSASITSNNTSSGSGFGSAGRAPSPARSTRPRLNLDDMGPVPTLPAGSGSDPHALLGVRAGAGDDVGGSTAMPLTVTSGTGKYPATFAEMGFHGAKAEEKECIIM